MRWVLSAGAQVGNALGPPGPALVGAGPLWRTGRSQVQETPQSGPGGAKAQRSFAVQTSGGPRAPEKAVFLSYQACVLPRPTDLC